jgi:arylformamidase
MSDPIDISATLRPGMPIWPGSLGFDTEATHTFARGDDVYVSRMEMDVHAGTHVESALHYIEGGASVDSIPLAALVGPAYVADLRSAEAIGAVELGAAAIPETTRRLLLRTRNSGLLAANGAFRDDYVGLTADGAEWIARRDVVLAGIDYLSIQRFGEDPETHRILMRAGVAILEGLDLSDAEPGPYRLTCLPLKLAGIEAAPARAILERMA